jgi:hypothetical protein
MGGARLGVYALLTLVFVVMADFGFHRQNDTSAQDADIVYCLAPAHLGGLVNAAEALSLAGQGSRPAAMLIDGHPISLARWRDTDAAEFEQACDAYALADMPSPPAAPSPDNGLETVADILLPVIAGALLTMAADDFKRAADRRWAQADELRTDWRAFRTAVTVFVGECVKPLADGAPNPFDMDQTRHKLLETVRKIRMLHPGHPKLDALTEPIEDAPTRQAPLGASLGKPWDQGIEQKRERKQQVVRELESYDMAVEVVAVKLGSKLWLPRR